MALNMFYRLAKSVPREISEEKKGQRKAPFHKTVETKAN